MENQPKNSDLLRQQIFEEEFIQNQAKFGMLRGDPDFIGEQIFNKAISKRDQLQKTINSHTSSVKQNSKDLLNSTSRSNVSLFSDISITSVTHSEQLPESHEQIGTPRKILISQTLNSSQFKIIALKYKENLSKINMKMESYKSKNKKKLFSLFRVYDFQKKEHNSMMHVYKRNLTPIRENYQNCNTQSPYENNFIVFQSGFVQSHFKQEYLNIHQDVQVSSKSKNFSTFSVIQQKQQYEKEDSQAKSNKESLTVNSSQIMSKPQTNSQVQKPLATNEKTNIRKNLKSNIQKLKEARLLISPEAKRIKSEHHQKNQSFQGLTSNIQSLQSQANIPLIQTVPYAQLPGEQQITPIQQSLQRFSAAIIQGNNQPIIAQHQFQQQLTFNGKKIQTNGVIYLNDPNYVYQQKLQQQQIEPKIQQQQNHLFPNIQTVQKAQIYDLPSKSDSNTPMKLKKLLKNQQSDVISIQPSDIDTKDIQIQAQPNQIIQGVHKEYLNQSITSENETSNVNHRNRNSGQSQIVVKKKKVLELNQRKQSMKEKHEQDIQLFMYNPADSVPKANFDQLQDNVYSAIFNYKEPLNKQVKAQTNSTIKNDTQNYSTFRVQSQKKGKDQNNYETQENGVLDSSIIIQNPTNKIAPRRSLGIQQGRPKNLTAQNSMISGQFQTQQQINDDPSLEQNYFTQVPKQSHNFELHNQLISKRVNQRNSTLNSKNSQKLTQKCLVQSISNNQTPINLQNTSSQIKREDQLSRSISVSNPRPQIKRQSSNSNTKTNNKIATFSINYKTDQTQILDSKLIAEQTQNQSNDTQRNQIGLGYTHKQRKILNAAVVVNKVTAKRELSAQQANNNEYPKEIYDVRNQTFFHERKKSQAPKISLTANTSSNIIKNVKQQNSGFLQQQQLQQ
eukprot:403338730